MQIQVEIDSGRPVFISANADDFGAIFAAMDSGDQVEVLRAMVKHMKPHPTQWDFISIDLELSDNLEIRDTLRRVLFP
ncbi:hypothetical protein [Mesorhizobium sp. M8A.F.Ca.ET.021.01.1.1]|uniref:hypothetical protein n=1 Tax=Mesorhizobium sp. M8A.F.Ca.ET.021.01.1.1 TaxID=2496757 RepID=UPI000FCC89E8|nr:hypothetical protein [Mesorhizobium sp. M8A.F.Ca.ET.021.01.1.1]RUW56380.1 hypothetical protein EOA36_04535 [Mesorhizobium sp. M8A.F.Ca.ET.021.01.1.1]